MSDSLSYSIYQDTIGAVVEITCGTQGFCFLENLQFESLISPTRKRDPSLKLNNCFTPSRDVFIFVFVK